MHKRHIRFKALIACAIVTALTTSGCSVAFNHTEEHPNPNKYTKEDLLKFSGQSYLANLEGCEIVIAQRVYKQTDFLFVERGSGTNHFVGTTYKSERILFDLPSDRSVNGTKNMITHFYQTRDECMTKPPTTSEPDDG